MSEQQAAILVVDDNEDNRYTLTRRLKREGYTDIGLAEDGRVALDLLDQRGFDLILLDIMMPEVSGYEVLERVKAEPKWRDIPVIMISAVDDMESVVRCIKLGAEDYLPKPFDATLLRARVTASLEKKRLRDRETEYLAQLEAERARIDELLHAILPAGAVKELKATDGVLPRRFEDVAVLFADIVSFTPYCEEHAPEQVVNDLQRLVSRFEAAAEAHGLEKIKTVGDAFMAAGGLLIPLEDPLLAAVCCGLEMVEISKSIEPHWSVRVGLHVGPVVAGIVGARKFLYDIWGDTVNVAARITDHADPNALYVSEEVRRRLGEGCLARDVGEVELKGKGRVGLFHIEALA